METRIHISPKLRFSVFESDKFTCQYCGAKAPEVILHVDHIVPVSKGGRNNRENLTTSCQQCNIGKGARLLAGIDFKPKYLWQATKNKVLFKKTYWGKFEYDKSIKPIVKNRDRFTAAQGLQSYVKGKISGDFFFDHVEIYETKKRRLIVVTSPYRFKKPEFGFFVAPKIYSNDACSFYRIFSGTNELNDFCAHNLLRLYL